MLANTILNLIGFGIRFVSNGEVYISVVRIDQGKFLAVKEGSQLPAQVVLAQADLAAPPVPKNEGNTVSPPAAKKPPDSPGAKKKK